MSRYLMAMQSALSIFAYHRPDRWLRSNSEFLIVSAGGELGPYLVIGVGPKSRGDEAEAADDLKPAHVLVGTRVGAETDTGESAYVLNRYLPDDLAMPPYFRTGQFFPADGTAEVAWFNGAPRLTVLGRHAHVLEEDGTILEVVERGMRCRVHVDGRVADVPAALTWQFTAERLPWSLEEWGGKLRSISSE